MVTEAFRRVFRKFKLHFYHDAFQKWKGRELSLTTVETFCMEMIYYLNRPTISQFSRFASLSSANAADKINNLVSKGYLNRIQDEKDRRKFYLEPTQKYLDYYEINNSYVFDVWKKVEEHFSREELDTVYKVLDVMDKEFMKLEERQED